jgi:hypothetical protein
VTTKRTDEVLFTDMTIPPTLASDVTKWSKLSIWLAITGPIPSRFRSAVSDENFATDSDLDQDKISLLYFMAHHMNCLGMGRLMARSD